MANSWGDIDSAFDRAIALDGETRRAFLAGLPNDELRAEVESLLAADSGATALIEDLVGSAASTLDDSTNRESLKEAGPWKLERLLGEGGMGSVHFAERQGEGFRQTSALKLLRPGLSTRFFVSRFRQERRILSTLDHPNIARLLDGGTASDGRPYLAVEYVDGETITRYCESRTQTQRIQLFLDVCRAVEHAHQRMVIHRDLKPSNIMVNREGQVKLLDFGIAKILDPDLTGGGSSVALTGTDVKLMTPDYAAPEQVRGETITTATDVYCLGLVLYEVLTGKRPFQLPTNAPLESARIVCSEEPAKSGLAADLDAIVRKCLRKEAASRYASISGLREDLERALRGEAVTAYQGAWTYHAGKWIRRYKWGVAAAALIAAAIGGGGYEVNEAEHTVTHHPEGSLVRPWWARTFPACSASPTAISSSSRRGPTNTGKSLGNTTR